jgi:ferredoxin-NADP reductase/Na+-translocating ferredoxin:NAD+ oxidoreductase RnfD subunit
MIEFIDNRLDRITMYRLTLYYLIVLLAAGVVLAGVGVLHVDPFAMVFTTGFLVGACALVNWVFAKVYGVPSNAESAYITALVLALIVAPLQSYGDLWFLGWAAVWAMASKYIFAIKRKHLFNPAAFAVALTYFTINQSANWWVGSGPMLPFVALGGVLVARKTRRADLVIAFLLAAVWSVAAYSWLGGESVGTALVRLVADSPLLFFAFVILTEPLTMPGTQGHRLAYGALVGVLFTPLVHLGTFYTTPEVAILVGNVYAYLVSPKMNLLLRLKEKVQVAPDIWDFVFVPSKKLAFVPGQYMEWTLATEDDDSRGNRRYFTLASSPTEATVRLGVKFHPNSSTLKRSLLAMRPQDEILATHLAGDFVLPADPRQKCVFIAGGIGITPFRSMVQYLLDMRQWRPVVLFYVAKTPQDFVYRTVFEQARQALGMKTIYTVTDKHNAPARWNGSGGRVTPQMIRAEVPDYETCQYYISGPSAMVESFRRMLRQMGVREDHIKTDFFSGLA